MGQWPQQAAGDRAGPEHGWETYLTWNQAGGLQGTLVLSLLLALLQLSAISLHVAPYLGWLCRPHIQLLISNSQTTSGGKLRQMRQGKTAGHGLGIYRLVDLPHGPGARHCRMGQCQRRHRSVPSQEEAVRCGVSWQGPKGNLGWGQSECLSDTQCDMPTCQLTA